jgi:hypothetical protein
MWRTRAVMTMLVEDVAALKTDESHPPGGNGEADEPVEQRTLRRARQRAHFVVALDWLAVTILFLLRDRASQFLTLGPSIETVFTLGILAVAVHSGFRLAQAQTFKSIGRVCDELRERRDS